MKKKTLSMLLVLLLLILAVPAGIADAKAQPQDIAFDLSGSWDEEYIDETGEVEDNYKAAVSLSGQISEKGEGKYLSPLHGTLALTPLHGTLAVDGSEYKIQVKQIKQSEPLYGQEGITLINGLTLVTAQTVAIVEANVQGDKFMGLLKWGSNTLYDADGGIMFSTGGSDLSLSGIVDGKLVSVSLAGENPEIE